MLPARKIRNANVAFEDLTTPSQRDYGVYLIRSTSAEHSETFTGPYRLARKLARSRTQYGDIELSFIEAYDTPAVD